MFVFENLKPRSNPISSEKFNPEVPQLRSQHWLFALTATTLLFAIVFARAPFRSIPDSLFVSDGFGYYVYLPSLVIDGDLELSNQLAYQRRQSDQKWYANVEQTQRPGNCFQVGCAILWAPFFVLAHALIVFMNAIGAEIPQSGFGFAYELPVYTGSFVYGLFGLWYMWKLLLHLYGRSVATLATVYTGIATALAAYLWFEPDMSHVPSMFLISAFFYHLYRIYSEDSLSWRRWAGMGILIGLIVAVRATDVFVIVSAVAVGVSACRGHHFTWGKALGCVVACAVCAFVSFAPQMLVWKSLYGDYLNRPPGVYQEFYWTSPDLFGLFFGPRRGIFVWTPLLVVAVAGLVAGLLRGPGFLRFVFPVLVLALYFNSILPNWWVGASFSERRTVDYSPIFALGLAQCLSLTARFTASWIVHAVGIPLCTFNWLLMLRYFTHDLPEYGYVAYSNLYVETLTFPLRIAARILP